MIEDKRFMTPEERNSLFKQEYLFMSEFSLTVGTMVEIIWDDKSDNYFPEPRIYIVTEIPETHIHKDNIDKFYKNWLVCLLDQLTLTTRNEAFGVLQFWYDQGTLKVIHKP